MRLRPVVPRSAARRHLMVRLEVRAGVGDEFAIGEPVERFDADNLCAHLRRTPRDVLDELVLGLGRPCHQHDPSTSNGVGHMLQEFMILRGVTATHGIGLVMDMACRIVRAEHTLINLGNVEMQHPRFQVIHPDDRVIVL
jgi:hypothetical protein